MKDEICMNRILGWDAAWTSGGSAAWCLIEKRGRAWCVEWNEICPTGERMLQELDERLSMYRPGLVTIDLPIARTPVRGYREADRATTRAFSRYGCPVHSPTPERPGTWGDEIMAVFHSHGINVRTSSEGTAPSVAEVYPHTVCLELVRSGYRVPYKIQRAARLFPGRSAAGRREGIAGSVRNILQAMEARIRHIPGELWEDPPLPLRHWKTREDRLDALLCAVGGIGILEGHYLPFGSEDAVIWNPDPNHLDLPQGSDSIRPCKTTIM